MGFAKMRLADYRYKDLTDRLIDEKEMKALTSSIHTHGLLNLTKDTAIYAIIDLNAIDANQLVTADMIDITTPHVVFLNEPEKIVIVGGTHRIEAARRIVGRDAE
jgi:hypothetical protein